MAHPTRQPTAAKSGEFAGSCATTAFEPAGDNLGERLARLEAENRTLRQELDRMSVFRHLAYRDDLTGLYNRRHFTERLTQEWSRANRFNEPLTVLLLDVDKFKVINDGAGHAAGDHVLTFIARQMSRVCRKFDVACRLGGDEFAYILPSTNLEGARVVAERLLEAIATASDRPSLPEGLDISLSIGIADRLDASSAADLVKRADAAMYDRKRCSVPVAAA